MDFALGLGSPDPDLIGALFPARMHLRLNLRLKVCCLGSGQGRQENHAKVGHVPSIVDTCDQDFFLLRQRPANEGQKRSVPTLA